MIKHILRVFDRRRIEIPVQYNLPPHNLKFNYFKCSEILECWVDNNGFVNLYRAYKNKPLCCYEITYDSFDENSKKIILSLCKERPRYSSL